METIGPTGLFFRRPLDKIVVHADEVRLPVKSFGDLARNLGLSGRSVEAAAATGYVFTYACGNPAVQESNVLSIDVSRADIPRNPRGLKVVDIALDQEWVPVRARGAGAKKGTLERRFASALAFLEKVDLERPLHCHVDFYFEPGTSQDIGFPLPFPSPFPSLAASDTPGISGIKLTGSEPGKSVLFDRLPDGTLYVSAQFHLQSRLSPGVIVKVKTTAEAVVGRVAKLLENAW